MWRFWLVRKRDVGKLVLVVRISEILRVLKDRVERVHSIACQETDFADEALEAVNDHSESLEYGKHCSP